MLLNPTDRYLLKKGKKEGKKEGKLEVAKNLLADGHSIEYVAKISGLSKKDLLKSNQFFLRSAK